LQKTFVLFAYSVHIVFNYFCVYLICASKFVCREGHVGEDSGDQGQPPQHSASEQPQDTSEGGDDPIEETLYTSFMQALATGADASQAFNVATHSAKQIAMDHGIAEDVYEKVASDLFAPYSQALSDGQSPQEALRSALQSLDN
jgi:hypothetical protein